MILNKKSFFVSSICKELYFLLQKNKYNRSFQFVKEKTYVQEHIPFIGYLPVDSKLSCLPKFRADTSVFRS